MPTQVKRGSVAIPIYHTPGKRGEGWTLAYRELDGTRRRVFRSTLAAAKLEAETVATRLANVQDTLVGLEAREASQAGQIAKALGTTLPAAIMAYSEAMRKLGGKGTLMQAVEYFVQRHAAAPPPVLLAKLRDEFLAAQVQDGVSERYIGQLRQALKDFCEDFACTPDTLSASLIDDWLRTRQRSRKWTGRTRNHHRAAISNLLNYAKRRRYLPRDWSEMSAVSKAVEEDDEIGIYSPGDLRALLAQRPDADLLPFVVVGAFTGARPSEIARLRWEDFHFDSLELFIGKGKVRTAGHRVVPILPACYTWLKKIRKASGPLTHLRHYSHPLGDLARAASVAPVHDGLRHSFITYRRALTKDLQQVSGEVGTDPKTLTRRYCRPVRLADAEAWFAVMPS